MSAGTIYNSDRSGVVLRWPIKGRVKLKGKVKDKEQVIRQLTGAGETSVLLLTPAGTSCTATVTAVWLVSFRTRCTCPLLVGSMKVLPAE
jgi:hypothetical protein